MNTINVKKVLLSCVLCSIVLLSCDWQRKNIEPEPQYPAYTLSTDCHGAEEYEYAYAIGFKFPDISDIWFGLKDDPFYGHRDYNSKLEFDVPSNARTRLFVYSWLKTDDKFVRKCLGEISWEPQSSATSLVFPLRELYDTFGSQDFFLFLFVINGRPCYKYLIMPYVPN